MFPFCFLPNCAPSQKESKFPCTPQTLCKDFLFLFPQLGLPVTVHAGGPHLASLLHADLRPRLLFLHEILRPTPSGSMSWSETTTPFRPGSGLSFHSGPWDFPVCPCSILCTVSVRLQHGRGGSPLYQVTAILLEASSHHKIWNCEMITSENCDDHLRFCQMTTAHIFFQPREQFSNWKK